MILSVILILSYFQFQNVDSFNYAVVEYQRVVDFALTPDENTELNAQNYLDLLDGITEELDLIVFPEATLIYSVENITESILEIDDEYPNPCENPGKYPNYIKSLSCAAKKAKTFIVINTTSRVPCDGDTTSENCKKLGYYLYNTNVVFDREGTIVQRYYKRNLFGEDEIDRSPSTTGKWFLLDGTKVGLFTCFDIEFNEPIADLLANNVEVFAYPTMWYGELPFLTALQAQQMWSQCHNVTLLAAGASEPWVGSGGTGIYYGEKGPKFNDVLATGGKKVYYGTTGGLSSEDPEITSQKLDKFNLMIDPTMKDLTSIPLPNNMSFYRNETLCYANSTFCCKFLVNVTFTEVPTEGKQVYVYHLAAYQGTRSFSNFFFGGIEVCGVIACLNASRESCGQRFDSYETIAWPLVFDRLVVEAEFDDDGNRMQFPNSLLSTLRPIQTDDTLWTKSITRSNMKNIVFTLEKSQDRLLTFGIFGRNFGEDHWPGSGSHNDNHLSFVLIIVVVTIVTIRVYF